MFTPTRVSLDQKSLINWNYTWDSQLTEVLNAGILNLKTKLVVIYKLRRINAYIMQWNVVI